MLKDNLVPGGSGTTQETRAERNRRRTLGIYYTPPEAAMTLARWAIQNPNDTVLEPSFGGCSMLSAAVEVFRAMGNHSPSKQLYGYDVDPAAFTFLAELGIDNTNGQFKKQDFLRAKPNNLFVDAVLANPPFLSYHRLNENQRKTAEGIRNKHLPALPKRASIWAHFLLHSLTFLKTGGRMAFVLPNTIGNADYAQPLMTFLKSKFTNIDLIHVSERLFVKAGTDERTSMLFLSGFMPEGSTSPAQLNIQSVGNLEKINISTPSQHQKAKDKTKHSTKDCPNSALELLHGTALSTLGSIALVQIGEVIGDIHFLVRQKSEWIQRKIDSQHLAPLLTRSAQVPCLNVSADASQQVLPSIPYLLLPSKPNLPKAIEAYLAPYPKEAISANKTFGKRPVWYKSSYLTNADAFIGSMSHDFPKMIENSSKISCSNAFYKIILINSLDYKGWLPIISLTTPFRLSAEVLGRIRGSGGIKLEPSDVKRLLIPAKLPALPKKEFRALQDNLDKMLRQGEFDAASQLADFEIFIKTGLIDAPTLSKLRLLRLQLTGHRFLKTN